MHANISMIAKGVARYSNLIPEIAAFIVPMGMLNARPFKRVVLVALNVHFRRF